MNRDSNYPDDIRQYDSDPRSPYYVDDSEWIEPEANELYDDWQVELKALGRIDLLDYDEADIQTLAVKQQKSFDAVLYDLAYSYVADHEEEFIDPILDDGDYQYDCRKDRLAEEK